MPATKALLCFFICKTMQIWNLLELKKIWNKHIKYRILMHFTSSERACAASQKVYYIVAFITFLVYGHSVWLGPTFIPTLTEPRTYVFHLKKTNENKNKNFHIHINILSFSFILFMIQKLKKWALHKLTECGEKAKLKFVILSLLFISLLSQIITDDETCMK